MDKITGNVLLVDGNYLFFRTVYGLLNSENSSDLKKDMWDIIISKIIESCSKYKIDRVYILLDGFKNHNWRYRYKDCYKSNRKPIEPQIKDLLADYGAVFQLCGFYVMKFKELEADDIIASIVYSQQTSGMIYIMSGDSDLYQLLSKKCKIIAYNMNIIDAGFVVKKTGISNIGQYISYKALVGDAGDNLTGVPNIGRMRALKLLQTYGNLDRIMYHLEPDNILDKNLKVVKIGLREMISTYALIRLFSRHIGQEWINYGRVSMELLGTFCYVNGLDRSSIKWNILEKKNDIN